MYILDSNGTSFLGTRVNLYVTSRADTLLVPAVIVIPLEKPFLSASNSPGYALASETPSPSVFQISVFSPSRSPVHIPNG